MNTNNKKPEQLMYIHTVAKILDCLRPMVYKLVYEGKIKAVRIGKRGIRITQQSLNDFIEANTVDSIDVDPIGEGVLI
jgi:excisionase family DNA binding protein